MRTPKGLDVADTIYENDQEEQEGEKEEEEKKHGDCLNSTTTTNLSFSPSSSLQRRVKAWSQATGCQPDVVIRVHDQCFHLHRDPLLVRSGYLRRHLTESSDITVSLPSGITAETFADVACCCYGADVVITPLNIAVLRVAAEWLEMADGGGLLRRTEAYFFDEVAADAGKAAEVLRSCAKLLAGEEKAAAAVALAERCVEVLAGPDGGRWLDEVAALSAEVFWMIAESMRARFDRDHDLLYRIVDNYLRHQDGKLTEEEKSRICYTVDCTKLSQPILDQLVQNPHLPLRFVVQAMLVDHLHTRSSVIASSATASNKPPGNRSGSENMTIGAILQRDAFLRRLAHLRSTMEAASFQIENVERDLASIRERLTWSEEKKAERKTVRSASFRIFRHGGEEIEQAEAVGPSGKSCMLNSLKRMIGFGSRLRNGLKSLFRRRDGESGDAEQRRRGHRRSFST